MKASLNRWIGKVPDVSAVLSRFPVAVALMAVFTVLLIFIDQWHNHERLGRLMAGLVLSAYMAVNVTLARETHNKSPGFVIQIGLSAVLLLLAWFSKDIRFVVPMAIGGAVLLLGNMVQWRKSRDDLHVWDFTHKIWTGAAFAALGSMIYTAGVFAISGALKSLFGLNINDFVTDFLLPIGLGFLAPLYWLSTIPPVDEDVQELHDNPGFVSKAVAFLGTWILSPLTLIYALILVAYGLKIILAGELPKGEIAGLTTPFLIIGTLTWLVLDPPFAKDKTLAKLFRKFWFFLSIPAALLLAVAVGVRVGEYGFTWERLALIFCVIWSLCLGVWFAFGPKDKRDIRIIPGFAAALMFIGAFAILPLSLLSQTARAKSGLKKAGIMTDAGIVKPQSEITITDIDAARKAKGALEYLENHEGWPAITRIFDGAEDVPTENGKPERMLYERLSLKDISIYSPDNQPAYVSYYADNQAVSVTGFDTLSGPYWVNQQTDLRPGADNIPFEIVFVDQDLIVRQNDAELSRYDIIAWIDAQPQSTNQLEVNDPVIKILEDGDKRISMLVRNISYNSEIEENFHIEFMLLTAGF